MVVEGAGDWRATRGQLAVVEWQRREGSRVRWREEGGNATGTAAVAEAVKATERGGEEEGEGREAEMDSSGGGHAEAELLPPTA